MINTKKIDPTHLGANPWFMGKTTTFGVQPATWQDGHGHGTHVMGITAQILKNYTNISYISIKTQDNMGASTVWDLVKGIGIAVQQGAKIVNMSLGYWPDPVCVDNIGFANYTDALRAAMEYAGQKYNITFVTSAGKQATLLGSPGFYIFPSMYKLPNQINVAAVDGTNALWYSGVGAGSNYGAAFVDIVAPGVRINSSYVKGYADMTGTSMAAPHITAITAIVAALHGRDDCERRTDAPICGVQSEHNPHFLLIKNSILNTDENNSKRMATLITNKNVKYFPNPVQEKLTISATSAIHKVEILNSIGQSFLLQNSDNQLVDINTSSLISGIYFAKVFFDEKKYEVLKFVKN